MNQNKILSWWKELFPTERMELCQRHLGHPYWEDITQDGIKLIYERATREHFSGSEENILKLEQPQIVVANLNGKKYLFASDSFLNQFPEMINQVYAVPDLDYNGPYFEKYIADRIRIIEGEELAEASQPTQATHHPHEVEMWPDKPIEK